MKSAAACLVLLLLSGGVAVAEGPQEVITSRFSGKPVPRFETLRYASVNGRAGPSTEHPVVWEYQRKGLPVMIVKESEDWRRVRDPSGDEVWVHARMLSPAASIITRAKVTLRRNEDVASAEVAEISPGVVADVRGCGLAACEVKAGAFTGWAPREALWGLSDASDVP